MYICTCMYMYVCTCSCMFGNYSIKIPLDLLDSGRLHSGNPSVAMICVACMYICTVHHYEVTQHLLISSMQLQP